MFARKAYDKLVEWKRVSNGKTAVMIEGARRVGKSTVAEAFAKVEYRDYLMLDFSVESEAVKRNFAENIGDLDAFFRNLFLLKGKSLPRGESVVVFDEVQLFPLARQAIKQLVKDGRYHYIETGSLISIRENSGSILIPSEEYQIRMHPMDFEEFLWAKGDTVTADAIREAFAAKKPLGTDIHRKIMGDFRMYMAVGGMPQAVAEYVAGGTFEEIDFAKRAILSLYDEDMRRYDNAENGRVSAIYRSVPDQLGNRNMRFKYAAIDKNARYGRLVSSLDFLSESMIVNVCTNVTAPDALMELHVQKENFKMFMADTGLLAARAMGTAAAPGESLYRALVFDKLDANLGMVMENMVAQMLVAQGHALHFHEFECRPKASEPSKKEPPKKYEVDFLLLRGKRVCPVEVKSSGYRAHKSLDRFLEKYDVKCNECYVLYPKDLAREGRIVYLPLYMAMCL